MERHTSGVLSVIMEKEPGGFIVTQYNHHWISMIISEFESQCTYNIPLGIIPWVRIRMSTSRMMTKII